VTLSRSKAGQIRRISKEAVYKVSAKDVDAEIDKIRNKNARWWLSKGAKLETPFVLDIQDIGERICGARGGPEPCAGANQFITGFETQLVGSRAGRKRT
jgi:trigger factor